LLPAVPLSPSLPRPGLLLLLLLLFLPLLLICHLCLPPHGAVHLSAKAQGKQQTANGKRKVEKGQRRKEKGERRTEKQKNRKQAAVYSSIFLPLSSALRETSGYLALR